MALFTKLPNWASILITVITTVIVVGLVAWGGYELFKPSPSKLPEGGEVVEEKEKVLPEEEDEFANWKTYQNEEYGFEFKYPNDFKIREGGTPLETPKTFEIYPIDERYSTDNSSHFITTSLYLTARYPYERVLSTYDIIYSDGQYSSDRVSIQEIKVGGKKAITFEINLGWIGKDYKGRNNAMYTKVIIERDKYTYSFSAIEDFKTIFNQILSTFKFLD